MPTDPFYQEEADRLVANITRQRGGGGGSAPTPAPSATPTPSGAQLGRTVRSGFTRAANNVLSATEGAVNQTTAPVRGLAGFSRDFSRAVTGQPDAPDVGKPLGGVQLPRLGRTSRTPATATAAAPASTPVPTVPTPLAPRPAGPAAGSLNTFTGSDGRTVAVAPAAAPAANAPTLVRQPAAPAAAPAPAFDPQAQARTAVADQRGVANQVRSDVASNLVPGSTGDEILRRLQHSQGSYFNRGSPSARAAAAAAYGGQLAALNGASAGYQQGANQSIGTGLQGAVQEGLADQDIAGKAKLRRIEIAGQSRLQGEAANQPEVVRGAEDGVVRLRRGGTASAVTDENGQPIREARARAPGAITPQDLLKSYTEERSAITSSLGSAEEKQAALAALDANPLYGPITGQGAPAAPPDLATFLQTARAANPGVSDEELTSYYNQNYGAR